MGFKKTWENLPSNFFSVTVCFILGIMAAFISGNIISDNELTFFFLGEKTSVFFYGGLIQIAMVVFFFLLFLEKEEKFWKKLIFYILTFSITFTISFLISNQWNWLIFFAGPLVITMLSIISSVIIFMAIVTVMILAIIAIIIVFLIFLFLFIIAGFIFKHLKKATEF